MVASANGPISPDDMHNVPVERASGEHADRYTGVVLIHGIGDEKRNETLQEALNALTHWFNQVAGLALRPSGPGRVWVRTDLTNDDDPDSRSSRATLELEAPSDVAAQFVAVEGNRPLRLEMREVWWAQSFGLPPAGASLAWATRQLLEELRILVPTWGHAGITSAAQRTPARETPQAVTYRPDAASGSAEMDQDGMSRLDRRWREGVLWLYDGVQAALKALELLALAPVVLLLLVLVRLVRLLAFVPFLQSAVISGLANLVNYVSLHWIGSLRVYLLDYTRSASMRQLFEREVGELLRDEHCERIVVIAHSMGTVIAYEGLATGLMSPDAAVSKKPITFICLAQALRRLWALKGLDPHRLRYVLPDQVRWLHFWARYDPVSVGPLNSRILPRVAEWTDREVQDPHEKLCAHLDGCENVDVVNSDSIFTDHVTYWENIEQVVGPIALKLVDGHPALEQFAREHQATRATVLRRRMRVAGRQVATLVGGITIGALLLVLDLVNQWHIGGQLRTHGITKEIFDFLVSALGLGLLADQYNHSPIPKAIDAILKFIDPAGAPNVASDMLLTLVVGLLVMLITFVVIGKVVVEPSPYESTLIARLRSNGTRSLFFLSAGFIPFVVTSFILVFLISFILFFVTDFIPGQARVSAQEPIVTLLNFAYFLLLLAWCLWLVGIWFAALLASRRRQQWGWFTVILIAPFIEIMPLFLPHIDFGALWLLVEALFVEVLIFTWGAWVVVIDMWRRGRVLRGLALLVAFGVAQMTSIVFLPLAPAILYGTWVGPAISLQETAGKESAERSNRPSIHLMAMLALTLVFADYAIVAGTGHYLDPAAGVGLSALAILGSALSLFAWIWGVQDIVAGQRWAWLIGYLVGTALAFALAFALTFSFLSDALSEGPGAFFLYVLCPALLVGVLVYCLWAKPAKRRAKPAGLQMQAPPPISGSASPALMPPSRPVWQPPMPPQSQYPPVQGVPPGMQYPPHPQAPYGPPARPGYMPPQAIPPQPMPPAPPGYGTGMPPQHSVPAREQGHETNRQGYAAPGAMPPNIESPTQPYPGAAPQSFPPKLEEPHAPPTSEQGPPRM